MNCLECNSKVSVELRPEKPLTASLLDAVIAAGEGDEIELSRTCWNCGWNETRWIRIDEIEEVAGDEKAVKRASLITEITNEAQAIDSLAALEDALAEVRRQRRLEPDSRSVDESSSDERQQS